MKEQKKSTSKVIVRSALILLLLTLISGCFLGSTFARYVSKGEGDLSAGVAKWDVSNTLEGNGDATVSIDKFSPMQDIFTSTATPRKNTVDVTLLTITNDGELDAYVKVTIGGNVTLYDGESQVINLGSLSEPAAGGISNENAPTTAEIDQIFDLTSITYKIDNADVNLSTDEGYTDMYKLEKGKTLTVAATVTWTTDLENEVPVQADGWPIGIVDTDLRDTWIGENVASVGWSYSWYAVQGSELPSNP